MINEIVRTPDPISISKNVEGHFENSDSTFEENQYGEFSLLAEPFYPYGFSDQYSVFDVSFSFKG